MFSISSSYPNPNPNRKSTKFKRKKRKPQIWKKKKNIPNWVELPESVWSKILSKLNTIDVIENAQKVCMLFRKLCKQPSMFEFIDMTVPDAYMDLPYDVNLMTRFAVDRSNGCLVDDDTLMYIAERLCKQPSLFKIIDMTVPDAYVDFNLMTRFAVDRSSGCLVDVSLVDLYGDDTFMYIAERSKNLKHLRLGHDIYVSNKALTEAVKGLPALEEVELITCSFSKDTIEAIGRTCPSLKSFTLNVGLSKKHKFAENEKALAISKSMPNLRSLQLIGNCMTNEGLNAILDGCPLLESLDLRACFFIDLSGGIGKRCEEIKHLRKPYDSTADYIHQDWQL